MYSAHSNYCGTKRRRGARFHQQRRNQNLHQPEIHPRASTLDRTSSPTHPRLQCGRNSEQRSTYKRRTPICQSLHCQHRQRRHHLRPYLAQAGKPQDRLENWMS
ncbi:hypothetical protein IEO21_11067 [Rhodonia placenta]|uniref:Uncharacterized protein n=1 Tax=Rhodonia placenta TaxID=104341 RepID=A0A8H7NR92_9APHY|nr:hypothetical protein IEO21_11067 [Postia placenta]